MYTVLLFVHSLLRWAVVAGMVYAVFRAWHGWLGKRAFSAADDLTRHTVATLAHLQLAAGIWLYFVSPIISYFLHDYADARHNRAVRFFGMEHSVVMLLSILLLTAGSVITKRKTNDAEKFKTMAIWFSVALVVILLMVPWPFSPMAQRPYLRMP